MPTLRRYASRVEADLATSYLRAQGFDAETLSDDAGGLHPELGYGIGGSRVVVPGEQFADADALIDAVDGGGEEPTFVLVHGAWHGGWAWEAIHSRLTQAGRRCVVVDLPSSGDDPSTLGGFDDDVMAVRAAVDTAGDEVVLVGHSYGGVVITEAASDLRQVTHLVYLAALLVDVGGSLAGPDDRHLPRWLEFDDDATACRPTNPRGVFYGDVAGEVAEDAESRLGWQSVAALRGRVRSAAWRDVLTTYVVCDRDAAIPRSAQVAMSRHAGRVEHLDTSHSPFLSRPDDLTAILLALPTP